MFQMTTKVVHMTTAHSLNQALAEVLRASIVGAHMTQREVSAAAGIPLVTLNRKLGGTSSFTFVEVAAIADTLGVTVTDLVLRAERAAMSPAA